MIRPLLGVAAVLAVILTGCSDDPEPPRSSPTEPASSAASPAPTSAGHSGEVRVADELVTGLTSPWGLVVFDDGSLLIGERDTKKIKHVPAGSGEPRVVATIDAAVPEGEAGLLGLVATPDEKRVLAYYTSDTDNRLVSMSWDGRELGEPEVIYEGVPHGDGNRHEGGALEIGPDGLLYIATGETGIEPELAQDRESPAGKILRLTLAGEPAPGNPFGTEVYSWGHRNVEGLAFDDRGRLWASEFGDATWDELNLIEPGANYGWPEVEGPSPGDGGGEFTDPAEVWNPAGNSPAGLAYWAGSLWMAGLRGETLWEIPVDRRGRTGEPIAHFEGKYGRLRSIEVAADGQGLLLMTSNTDGRGEVREGDDRMLLVTR